MKGAEKKKEQKRIRKYARFLKHNYEWDYIHIIDLLRFKIKMMRKFIKTEGHMVDKTWKNR